MKVKIHLDMMKDGFLMFHGIESPRTNTEIREPAKDFRRVVVIAELPDPYPASEVCGKVEKPEGPK